MVHVHTYFDKDKRYFAYLGGLPGLFVDEALMLMALATLLHGLNFRIKCTNKSQYIIKIELLRHDRKQVFG